MTFEAFETSEESGQVLELYTFTFGPEVFRLTSFNRDIVWQALSYEALQISRTETQASVEDAINQITITMPLDHPIPQKFIQSAPGRLGTVRVLRAHANDPAEEAVVIFDGTVANSKIDGELEAKILCKPKTQIFKRSAPRYTYQALCNHQLYDARCKVNRAAFTHTDQVTGVSGSTITVNGLSANGADWAVGGFVRVPAGGKDDARMILEQAGDTITLLLPFSLPVLGTDVDVFAGCKHDTAVCVAKFNNIINYGGTPYVPRKNPFSTTLRGGS